MTSFSMHQEGCQGSWNSESENKGISLIRLKPAQQDMAG